MPSQRSPAAASERSAHAAAPQDELHLSSRQLSKVDADSTRERVSREPGDLFVALVQLAHAALQVV